MTLARVRFSSPHSPKFGIIFGKEAKGNMCTMMIPSSVCRRKPVKIVRDTTLDGLPAYIKEQCATPRGRRAYLASIGIKRHRNGSFTVTPL